MLHALIAYDANGNVVATLDHMVATDDDGNVVGLIDFEAHEAAGGRLREIWENSTAIGSGTWPEWLSGRAYDFRVELDPNPAPARARIKALVHKQSGHRRERAVIEEEVGRRVKAAAGKPADLRDLLGGPNAPLLLDDEGKTQPKVGVARPALPVVSRRA